MSGLVEAEKQDKCFGLVVVSGLERKRRQETNQSWGRNEDKFNNYHVLLK